MTVLMLQQNSIVMICERINILLGNKFCYCILLLLHEDRHSEVDSISDMFVNDPTQIVRVPSPLQSRSVLINLWHIVVLFTKACCLIKLFINSDNVNVIKSYCYHQSCCALYPRPTTGNSIKYVCVLLIVL